MMHSNSNPRLEDLLAEGNLFEDKYRVVCRLGTGSFARVVKARHEVMGRQVALKCLKPSVVRSNPEVSERFVNEVQIVSRLRHPNTVTIFDFGQTDQNLAYMVLEYLDGQTLDERLAQDGALEERRARDICGQIIKSLSEAHGLGIVHRDLKPSNVMLCRLHGESDFVKVLDFGVAKLLADTDGRDEKLKPRSTQFIGTPVYMSPEQVLGQPVTAASDVYSLGLLVYEMLTGQPPIDRQSVAAVVRDHLDDQPLPLSDLSTVSTPLRKIIRRCTHRDPGQRFASVAALAAALGVDGPGAPIGGGGSDRPAGMDAPRAAGLGEESSEAGVFSGENYVAPPADDDLAWGAASSDGSTRARRRQQRPTGSTDKPDPTVRTDELALDLDRVDRHRRRVQRQRQHGRAGGQRADDGWLPAVHWERAWVYAGGILAGYTGFVVLSAMLVDQPPTARLIAGGLMVLAALGWTGFSSMQAVAADPGRRWLLPTAKYLACIAAVVVLVGLLGCPDTAARGLQTQPTWFYDMLPQAAPVAWLEQATRWEATQLAGLFSYMYKVLPY